MFVLQDSAVLAVRFLISFDKFLCLCRCATDSLCFAWGEKKNKCFNCCCQVSLKVFFGKPGPWFQEGDLDGDKNSIFHDLDGSVTDYKDTYVGRMDNYLIQHPKCINIAEWSGVVCSGTYAQASTLKISVWAKLQYEQLVGAGEVEELQITHPWI